MRQVLIEPENIGNIMNIIEAVLFSAGEPVKMADLLDIAEELGTEKDELKDIILNTAGSYNAKNTGLEIIVMEDYVQMVARAEYIGI